MGQITGGVNAGDDIQATAYGGIELGDNSFTAANDIQWLWSRGNLTGTFTAGHRIGISDDAGYPYSAIEVYGAMDATITAGLPGWNGGAHDGYWGQIDAIQSWGGIAGSITANHGVVIASGGAITAALNYATAPVVEASSANVFITPYPADPQVSLDAAQAALRQATGQAAAITQALTQGQSAAASAWQAAQAQLAAQEQQLTGAVSQGQAAAQVAIHQTSQQVGILLAQDQAQGKQALSLATVQTQQAIASAQNQAAEAKAEVSTAITAGGNQITADENRLQQERTLERSDAATLVTAQQQQYTISSNNIAATTNAWSWQFDVQSDAQFEADLNALTAARTQLSQGIHQVLTWSSVAISLLGPETIPITRVLDGVNAAFYLSEGNYEQAALCSITLVPWMRLFSTASEGARVALGLGEEAGLVARLGQSAGEGTGLARGALADSEEVEGALSREQAEAQSGQSTIDPNVESDSQALTQCDAPLGFCFTAGTLVEKALEAVAVETLRPGQRALTALTVAGGAQASGTCVDPATWMRVRLQMTNPEGRDTIDVDLLRPPTWLHRNQVVAGTTIHLSVEELGMAGEARVLAVEACPPIEDGPGRVVTATATHLNAEVLQLKLKGLDQVLEPTAPHQFFSESRGEWTSAVDLEPGERLRTKGGVPATVEWTRPKGGVHRVYNIEVEHEHEYFVSEVGVLVHNASVAACPFTDVYKVGTAAELRNFTKKWVLEANHAPMSAQGGAIIATWSAGDRAGKEAAILLPYTEHQAVTAAQAARNVIPASARDLLASELRILRANTKASSGVLLQLSKFAQSLHAADCIRDVADLL